MSDRTPPASPPNQPTDEQLKQLRLFEETHPDGIRELWIGNEHAEATVDVVMQDFAGRNLPRKTRDQAVALFVPVSGIGALLFDPTGQRLPSDHPQYPNFRIWAQRIQWGPEELKQAVDDRLRFHSEQMQQRARIVPGNAFRMPGNIAGAIPHQRRRG